MITTKELCISETVREYWNKIGFEPDNETKLIILANGPLPLYRKIELFIKFKLNEDAFKYNSLIDKIINGVINDVEDFKINKNNLFIYKLVILLGDTDNPFQFSLNYDDLYYIGMQSYVPFIIYKCELNELMSDLDYNALCLEYDMCGNITNINTYYNYYYNIISDNLDKPINFQLPFCSNQIVKYNNEEWFIYNDNDELLKITSLDGDENNFYNSECTLQRGNEKYYQHCHVDPLYIDIVRKEG